jgi:hypothetical protein
MHSIHIAAKALLLSVVAAAVGILFAAMLTFAANNVPVALTQAERPYPLEPLALPANLITGTPEQARRCQTRNNRKARSVSGNAVKSTPKDSRNG